MPKMRSGEHFWVQNHSFLTFLQMCSLDFPEIAPNVKHEKVDKNDFFGLRKFLVCPKWVK